MDNIDFYNKKILVTGGKGFLGTLLCEMLQKHNANVYCIDTMNCLQPQEYCVDITDKIAICECIQDIQPDIVFHLAAMLDRGNELSGFEIIHRVNYQGTINLLHALQNTTCENFIFTSTSEIYGGNQAPFTEDMIPQPTSSYSITKALAEHAIRYFSKVNNSNYTILRLFNFYGKDMPQNFFIPQMLKQLQHADVFEMTHGEQTRDFLHIHDVIQALMLAASNPKALNQTFNVCSGSSILLREFVLTCKKALNSSCQIKFGAIPYRKNEIWNMVGNNSKISTMLGFKPNYDVITFLQKI